MTDHLLAHAVDQLAEANWMFAMVNRDEEAEPPAPPQPLPRPGSAATDAAASDAPSHQGPDPARLAAFFAG